MLVLAVPVAPVPSAAVVPVATPPVGLAESNAAMFTEAVMPVDAEPLDGLFLSSTLLMFLVVPDPEMLTLNPIVCEC